MWDSGLQGPPAQCNPRRGSWGEGGARGLGSAGFPGAGWGRRPSGFSGGSGYVKLGRRPRGPGPLRPARVAAFQARAGPACQGPVQAFVGTRARGRASRALPLVALPPPRQVLPNHSVRRSWGGLFVSFGQGAGRAAEGRVSWGRAEGRPRGLGRCRAPPPNHRRGPGRPLRGPGPSWRQRGPRGPEHGGRARRPTRAVGSP